MPHSPETADRWYIAELTEEVTLEGDPKNLVHKKTRVIFADSPQDAYEKALSMITEHEISYINEHHKAIRTRFWGLRELDVTNEDIDLLGMLRKTALSQRAAEIQPGSHRTSNSHYCYPKAWRPS